MLPFDKIKTRTYDCFCCGLKFKTLPEMKDHILQKHEEGRDYILCPLKRCSYPVRDLFAHMRLKHPDEPMPKIGMTRAIVWHDQVGKSDRVKVKRPKFRSGYYLSTKMNKQFYYRSGYEAKVYECLDADMEVISYAVEPFEVAYIHQGKQRKYTPDLIVKYTNGVTKVIEIKPSAQSLLEVNKNKWHYATEACKVRGWLFEVWTETGIDHLKQKIKNQKLLN